MTTSITQFYSTILKKLKQNIGDGKEINLKQFEIIDKSIDKQVNMIAKILEKR